jgi:hypothetical protein
MSSTKQIATNPALALILLFTTDHSLFVSILEPSSTRKTPAQKKGISEHRIFVRGNSTVSLLEREGPQPLDSKTIYKRWPPNSISFAQGFPVERKEPFPEGASGVKVSFFFRLGSFGLLPQLF